MTTDFDTLKEIDSVKIKKALEFQVPIEVTTYTLPKSMEAYIRSVLTDFLTYSHQNHMIEYLNFCLGELLTNSKKANTKRVYFKEKGLDINDESQYEVGMKTFKEDTLSDINHYLDLQKKAGLYIKMLLQVRSDSCVRVEIRNNSKLTVFEKQRIENKISSVRQYTSINEVMSSVMDQSEGAGLGIIIMILMLQKIGLSKENYQIFDCDGETVTQIILPCKSEIQDGVNEIFNKYASSITVYPVLERNYKDLLKVISEGCDKSKIINLLNNDPMLSLLLLRKTLKSNQEIRISEIVKALSEDEIKAVFPENNPSVEFVNNPNFENYINVAAKTALCSYNIAKNQNQSEEFAEELYTIGLFSTLGRLLCIGLNGEIKADILSDIKNLETKLNIRDIYSTETNNVLFGCKILDLMNFPKKSLELLELSSEWILPKEIDTESVHSILVLAQMISYFDEKELEFYQLNSELLKTYGIHNEEQLNDFLSKIKNVM